MSDAIQKMINGNVIYDTSEIYKALKIAVEALHQTDGNLKGAQTAAREALQQIQVIAEGK